MDKERDKTKYKAKLHKKLFAFGVLGVIIINIASWKSVAFSDWYIKTFFPYG